jgi:hypothetical protein
MSRNRAIVLIIAVLASGGISFLATRLAAVATQKPERSRPAGWLGDAPASVVALEGDFDKEAQRLIETLLREQKSLGTAIEDPCTPDGAILAQVAAVIAAHEHLLKRVGEHIAALRSKLPIEQRQRLMSLCAEMVRGPLVRGTGRGPGYGGGSRMGPRDGSGMGRGAGGRGLGPGDGAGYGRGRRLGAGLAQSLRLTDEQTLIAEQQDPNFQADAAQLRNTLLAERAKLLAVFEDSQTTNDVLLQQLDKLIAAHSQIEQRVARHVLVLRPHLTADQQKWLIGLCRRQTAPLGSQE